MVRGDEFLILVFSVRRGRVRQAVASGGRRFHGRLRFSFLSCWIGAAGLWWGRARIRVNASAMWRAHGQDGGIRR
jgi:hypothetical protein